MHALTLLANWGPVALWATLMFYFSTASFSAAQTAPLFEPAINWLFPGMPTDWLDAVHLGIRKFGHWSEYFVFAILVLRALRRQCPGYTKLRCNALTLGIVFLYAASDELHQAFVPERTASFADVLHDTLGGICAVIWIILYHRRKKTARPMRS